MSASCALCGSMVGDASVCTGCSRRLEVALSGVPALVADLETVLARLTTYSEQAQRVSGSGELPVMFDQRASQVSGTLRSVLTSWVRIVWEERYDGPGRYLTATETLAGTIRAVEGQPAPTKPYRALPVDRVTACAGWLRPEVEWMRRQKWAPEAIGNLLDAITDIRTVLDAPRNRSSFPLGPCPVTDCDGEVCAHIPRDPNEMAHADCTVDPLHRWDSTQFLRLGKRMLKTEEVA